MTSRIAVVPNALLDAFKSSNHTENSEKEPKRSEDTRHLSFLTLPHPRTAHPALFIYVKDRDTSNPTLSEILEVQAVDPPASRSWFMDNDTVLEDGRLLIMTPIDPVFLMLPLLRATTPEEGLGNFRTLDDIFNMASTKFSREDKQANLASGTRHESTNLQDIADLLPLSFVPSAMQRVCDTQGMPFAFLCSALLTVKIELDEHTTVYRFSLPKTLQLLRQKASHLSSPEVVSRTRSMVRTLSKDGLGPDESVDEKLREAGRLKLSCEILSQYLPPPIYEALLGSYDFTSLNNYVRSIRAEDAPTAPTGKDAETSVNGASKKRKAETQVSRGAQKLLKTDTSKMAKLTSFFGKKPAATK